MPPAPPHNLCISLLLLLNAITSKGVTAVTFMFVLYYHDAFTVTFVVGALINAGVGKALKRLLNVRRPTNTLSTPGMPSSHATSLSYFAMGLTLITHKFGVLDSRVWTWQHVCGLTWTYVALVAYTRVRITKVHTVAQIGVGCVLGSTFALCWCRLVSCVLRHFLGIIWMAC